MDFLTYCIPEAFIIYFSLFFFVWLPKGHWGTRSRILHWMWKRIASLFWLMIYVGVGCTDTWGTWGLIALSHSIRLEAQTRDQKPYYKSGVITFIKPDHLYKAWSPCMYERLALWVWSILHVGCWCCLYHVQNALGTMRPRCTRPLHCLWWKQPKSKLMMCDLGRPEAFFTLLYF